MRKMIHIKLNLFYNKKKIFSILTSNYILELNFSKKKLQHMR